MQVVTRKECVVNLSSTANLTENIIYKSTAADMFIVYQFLVINMIVVPAENNLSQNI